MQAEPTGKTTKACETIEQFHQAYITVSNEPDELDRVIEVGDALFKHLTRAKDTPYLTYGNPSVRVYKAGTRDGIESKEKLSVNQKLGLDVVA